MFRLYFICIFNLNLCLQIFNNFNLNNFFFRRFLILLIFAFKVPFFFGTFYFAQMMKFGKHDCLRSSCESLRVRISLWAPNLKIFCIQLNYIFGIRQVVRQWTLNPPFGGSNPSSQAIFYLKYSNEIILKKKKELFIMYYIENGIIAQ